MTTAIQRRTKTTRQVLSAAAVAVSASVTLAFTPTSASAFDIGGLIGTAMALQVGHYHGGYSGGPSRSHVASRRDSNSSDHGNSGVERDARDPSPPSAASSAKSDNNHGAVRQQIAQGPSGPSGGFAQASEHDAAAGQVAPVRKSFDDAPVFSPSR